MFKLIDASRLLVLFMRERAVQMCMGLQRHCRRVIVNSLRVGCKAAVKIQTILTGSNVQPPALNTNKATINTPFRQYDVLGHTSPKIDVQGGRSAGKMWGRSSGQDRAS